MLFSMQINELKATVDGLEKERDFYFGKLRDIEVICQEMEEQLNAPIVQKILDILYATEVQYSVKLFKITLVDKSVFLKQG